MIKEFLEGETYFNAKYDKDVMVLGIAKTTDKEIVLAILWVDRSTEETTGGGELTVPVAELSSWELKEL